MEIDPLARIFSRVSACTDAGGPKTIAATTRQRAETALRIRPLMTGDRRLSLLRFGAQSNWLFRVRVTAISVSPDKDPTHWRLAPPRPPRCRHHARGK